MIFKVGDKVKLLNEVGEGEIMKIISSDYILVHTDLGIEIPYREDELLKINEDKSITYKKSEGTFIDEQNTETNKKNNILRPYLKQFNIGKKSKNVLEIDLHLEELVDFPARLKNYEKIQIQIQHCRACIEEAIQFKINRLVIIHGVGEGKLRNEIRSMLADNYSNIEFFDADIRRYGYGATEIVIRNLYQ